MPTILWSAAIPLAAKQPCNMIDAATLVLQLFSVQSVSIFFHQNRGHFSQKWDLCPNVQLQNMHNLLVVNTLLVNN